MSVPSLASRRPYSATYSRAPALHKSTSWLRLQKYVALLLVHGVGAVLLHNFRLIAPFYALGILGLGLWWAYNRKSIKVVYIGAYIVAAEVLWRMTGGNPVHEYGKYAIILLFSVALLRSRRGGKWMLPMLYFALLLPSATVTFSSLDLNAARQAVSGVLAGPLALAISVAYCSTLKITKRQLVELLSVMLLPVFGIAMISLFATLSASNIRFSTNSNRVTSGGWGANQVSSAMGLGAFIAFFCMILDDRGQKYKFLFFTILVLLLTQASMTFSRSGPYLAVGAILVGALFLMKDLRSQVGILLGGVMFFLLANYVILPEVDDFTEGAFEERVFMDRNDSGRWSIVQGDIELWLQNPTMGVGPGMSEIAREIMHSEVVGSRDHTEYSRLLSEHGVFGFAALLLLMYIGIVPFAKARRTQVRALRIAVVAWAVAYMMVNSTRIAAPGFLFGIAYINILWEAEAKPRLEHMRQRQFAKV